MIRSCALRLSVCDCIGKPVLGSTLRGLGALTLLLPKRTPFRGGRSLGTTRPPAVTRIPGGLPCSFKSRSALPRLTEGEGDGFFKLIAEAATPGAAAEARSGFSKDAVEAVPMRLADTEGRITCSGDGYLC